MPALTQPVAPEKLLRHGLLGMLANHRDVLSWFSLRSHLRELSTCNNFLTAFNELIALSRARPWTEGIGEARGLFQEPTSG